MIESTLYRKVSERIRGWMEDGTLEVGRPVPTVRELQAQCDVSHLTVLRAYRDLREAGLVVLRGKRYVVCSPEERNASARSMMIGMLIRPLWKYNDNDNFFNDILCGIQEECGLNGFGMISVSETRKLNQDLPVTAAMQKEITAAACRIAPNVDGFLLDERLGDPILGEIQKLTGKKVVLVGRGTALEMDSAGGDWSGAALRLGRSAERLGYRKFLFTVSRRNNRNEDDKIAGFMDFAKTLPREAYQTVDDCSRIYYDDARQKLLDALAVLKPGGEKIAILCSSDYYAREVEKMLREQFGWTPGKDYGLAGLGGLSCSRKEPQITTVDVQPEEIGRLAVQSLLYRIASQAQMPFQKHMPELIFRLSESL